MALTRWKNTMMCSACQRSWHFMSNQHQNDLPSLSAAGVCPHADCSSNGEGLSGFSYVGFDGLPKALAYKRQLGGWIFHANDGQVIWFDASRFTPSKIFAHPVTRGLSGCLV